jgi:cell division septation protein DedD
MIPHKSPHTRAQQGNVFIIVLLLIVGSLFVFACYNPDKVPKSVSGVLPTPPPSANNYHHSNQAIYTVQVAATTNRERAFQVKQAFKKEGYSARVEAEKYGREGIIYKVRIGKYSNEHPARQLSKKIRKVYSQNYADSFVYAY